MARRKRPGEWAIIYAEIPPALKDKLQAKADANRRSLTSELIVAIESHTEDAPRAKRSSRHV